MKKLKVILHEKAINDLDEIWLYTVEGWSVTQADRYLTLINNEIEFLAVNPQSGKNAEHIKQGYRLSKIKSYVIFYKISINSIEIVRILHENMDIPNRLLD